MSDPIAWSLIALLATALLGGFPTVALLINRTMRESIGGLRAEMNARFETVDARMEARFEAVDARIEARFEAVDARFETVQAHFDAVRALSLIHI